MLKFLYIALFGMLGVFARYFVGMAVARALPQPFPYGTFIINILGAFAIGVVFALGVEHQAIPGDLRIGLTVGFLGGFTTFSSYCLESTQLLEDGRIGAAMAYFTLSPMLGLGACFAGLLLARSILKAG